MLLTRAADYGVRVMMHLSTLPSHARADAKTLATSVGASPPFVGKILQQLVTARLVVSRRGYDGGFQLARPAFSISMLDVVAAVEGPLCLNACLPGGVGCNRRSWCAAHSIWAEAQESLARVLSSTSIDKLTRDSARNRAALEPSHL